MEKALSESLSGMGLKDIYGVSDFRDEVMSLEAFEVSPKTFIGFSDFDEGVSFKMRTQGQEVTCVATRKGDTVNIHQLQLKQNITYKLDEDGWHLSQVVHLKKGELEMGKNNNAERFKNMVANKKEEAGKVEVKDEKVEVTTEENVDNKVEATANADEKTDANANTDEKTDANTNTDVKADVDANTDVKADETTGANTDAKADETTGAKSTIDSIKDKLKSQQMKSFAGADGDNKGNKTDGDSKDAGKTDAEKEAEKQRRKEKKEAEKKKLENLRGKIQSKAESMADLRVLTAFNREYGEFLGFITTKDECTRFKVVGENKKDASGKNIIDKAAGLTKAGKPRYVKNYKLNVVNEKPGPVGGGILKLPVGGIKTTPQLLDPSLKVDTTQKELKTLVLSSKALSYILKTLCAGSIKESPSTFGKYAGTLYSIDREGKAKVRNSEDYETVVRYTLKCDKDKRRSIVCEGAYIPRKTFKTIEIPQGNLTEEQAAELNYNAFIPLFHISKTGTSAPYSKLVAEDQGRIQVEAEKKMADGERDLITSTFFKAGEEVNLSVYPYYQPKGKAEKQPVLALPIKKKEVSKTSNSYRYLDQYYDCADEDLTAEERKMTSFESNKFKKFLDTVGRDVLTPEVLLTTLKGNSNSNQDRLSSIESASATLLATTKHSVYTDAKLVGITTGVELDDLDAKLLDVSGAAQF